MSRPAPAAPSAGPAALLNTAPAYGGPRAGAPVAPHWGLATQAAQKHGLDPSLLAAVWDFESSGNPGAINRSSGATGLGQVMPRERGFPDRPTQQDLLDPATNAEWSARILKSGLDRYGSEDKALAAYLGAIDARGNITGAVDANGTGGNQYIRTVRERQARYAGGGTPGAAGVVAPAAAPAPAGPAWWQGVTGATDLMERPGPPQGRQTLPEPRPAVGASPQGFRPLTSPPTGSGQGAPGAAPAWWTAVAAPTPAGGGAARADPNAPVGEAPVKQAVAASWALSNLGSKDFYNLCQRFIEQAYGTGGQYGSAAAASKALFKTADPNEADVGDLVFFRPDASNGYAGHAAIYLGNGEMVGATNAGVTRDNIFTSPYWKNLLVGFGDPPDAWKGRPSSGDLMKGAGQLVGNAKAAVQGAAGAAAGTGPAWWGAVSGGRS